MQTEYTKNKRIQTMKNNGKPWHSEKTKEKMSVSASKSLEEKVGVEKAKIIKKRRRKNKIFRGFNK